MVASKWPVTIVTCFYKIPGNTKRSLKQYRDWMANFFDKCRIISDEEMQGLWAKVLSGEANAPGSYSKRTVNFLASMDKEDAALFTALCGFAWSFPGGYANPLIYNTNIIPIIIYIFWNYCICLHYNPSINIIY